MCQIWLRQRNPPEAEIVSSEKSIVVKTRLMARYHGSIDLSVQNPMTWDATNYGANQDGQWFPAAGTRVYVSGGLDFPEANPYNGLWIGTVGKASSNLEEYLKLYGKYMFVINGKRTFKVSKDARSQGMSLRCVKEDYHPAKRLP